MMQFSRLKEPSPSYTQELGLSKDRGSCGVAPDQRRLRVCRARAIAIDVALTFLQSVQDADNNVVEGAEAGPAILGDEAVAYITARRQTQKVRLGEDGLYFNAAQLESSCCFSSWEKSPSWRRNL